MSFKVFIITTMYPGNLRSFHLMIRDSDNLSYRQYLSWLMKETTEFAGSYMRALNQEGIDTDCIIANDALLQKKWKRENRQKKNDRNSFFLEQIRQFNPDVLWIDNLSFTDISFLLTVRNTVKSVKLIICFHCSPFGPRIIERLPYIDFVITCTPGLKDYLEALGHRSYLVYHGFDTSVMRMVNIENADFKEDIVFSGSLATGPGFHRDRINLLEEIIKSGLNLSLYVNTEQQYRIIAKKLLYVLNRSLKTIRLEEIIDFFPFLHYGDEKVKNYPGLILSRKIDPVFGADMYKLFSGSKVILNNHLGATGNYAGNMRLFEATGSGSCLLTDNKVNITDLFIPGKEIVVYDDINDCIEKARWLLDNNEERMKIAHAGRQRTLKEHTVEQRCHQICSIISDELKKSESLRNIRSK